MTGSPNQSNINELVQKQKKFFSGGNTLEYGFRNENLRKLLQLVETNEKHIIEALRADLRKPFFESIGSEIGFSTDEIRLFIRRLRKWMKPVRVPTTILNFPARSYIFNEPFGVSLIISPWNYPFQLCVAPLAGSMASGNCVVLKPSEFAPNTSGILENLVNDHFPENYIHVVSGGAETGKMLLEEKYDMIFYTGSERVGKIVAEKAAKTLTPVILEMGGKSPCIVDQNYDIPLAGKRIAWGKFYNCGQTCIAPDYLYVHENVHDSLIEHLKININNFYGEKPESSPDYARIVNKSNYDRLVEYIRSGEVIFGGDQDPDARYIGPTILDHVKWEDRIMQDEIFGPVLPVLVYRDIDEAIEQIREKGSPLSCYLFTNDKDIQRKFIRKLKFGGGAINDTLLHFITTTLPFGGIGSSGHGSYHGKYSFEAFSHRKSILKRGSWIDITFRYPPYTRAKEKILKIVSRINFKL